MNLKQEEEKQWLLDELFLNCKFSVCVQFGSVSKLLDDWCNCGWHISDHK